MYSCILRNHASHAQRTNGNFHVWIMLINGGLIGRLWSGDPGSRQRDGRDESPGPGWFPPIFFQQFWHIVGDKVVQATQTLFRTGCVPPHMNESLICLIMKGQCPSQLNQFRPISSCNVLLKIVTKVLANWLKAIMPKLTGPYQSSFLTGRSTIKNITVTQDMIHSLKAQKGSKGG